MDGDALAASDEADDRIGRRRLAAAREPGQEPVDADDEDAVTAANTLTRNMAVRMALTLEVRDLAQLTRALAFVRDVPGVLAVGRR